MGIFLTRSELDALNLRYPGLRQLASPPPAPWRELVTIAEPPPLCYFLRAEGLCGVEQEHGRALKPSGCRFFPFQRSLSTEKVAVIGYSELCPLEVSQGEPFAIRHALVSREFSEVGDGGWRAGGPPPPELCVDLVQGLDRERELMEASRQALEAGDVDAYLAAGGDDPSLAVNDLCRFLGIAEDPSSETLARNFIAAGPELRLRFALQERTPWSELPQAAFRHLTSLLPFAAVHERLSRRAPSISTLLHLQRELFPLLRLLAHLDDRPVLEQAGRIRVSPQIREATLVLRSTVAGGGLDFRAAIARAVPVPDHRAAFLRSLGHSESGLRFDRKP